MNKQKLFLCSLLFATNFVTIHAMKNSTIYKSNYLKSLTAAQKDLTDKAYTYINMPDTRKYNDLQTSYIQWQKVQYLPTGRSIAYEDTYKLLKIRKRSLSTPEFYTHIKRLI